MIESIEPSRPAHAFQRHRTLSVAVLDAMQRSAAAIYLPTIGRQRIKYIQFAYGLMVQ
jgi:hypothetical protein